MDQRCTKNCRSACSCCHTRNDLLFCFRIINADLIHQSCHTINSGITAADHRNRLAFLRFFKSKNAAVNLFLHWCSHKFFSREVFLYQINIYSVSDDRITFIHCADCLSCHLVISSRSDSDYIYFTQNVSSILWLPLLWSRRFLLLSSVAVCRCRWRGLHFSHRHCPRL